MINFLEYKPSLLKKFLLINSVIFLGIGLLTVFYLLAVEPSLIKKKSLKHIQIIDNTINHIERLDISFEKNEINKFLLSTRFLFQNLDRVQFFDNDLNLIGDTDILDLDPRSFSKKLGVTEAKIGETETDLNSDQSLKDIGVNEKNFKIENIISQYKVSKNLGSHHTINNKINKKFISKENYLTKEILSSKK